jgi:Icc-related predicted phosphoesterase
MRIVCISDTHVYHRSVKVPKGDILVHAGDISHRGTVDQVTNFFDWFGSLPHPHKIFISGNHDPILQDNPEWVQAHLPKGVTYLQDSSVVIGGLKFYGSPWTPAYGRTKTFMLERDTLGEKWDQIPNDTDVLITHGPPHGILDITLRPPGEHVGCESLRKRVEEIRPMFHIFGHVHEAWGKEEHNGTIFVNASIWNHRAGGILQDPTVL